MATVVRCSASCDQTPPVTEIATAVVPSAGYDQTPLVDEMATIIQHPASYNQTPIVAQIPAQVQCAAGLMAVYKQQRLGKHLPYIATTMFHRCIGRGPLPETLHVGNTFVALQHPITRSDLIKTGVRESEAGKARAEMREAEARRAAARKADVKKALTELRKVLARKAEASQSEESKHEANKFEENNESEEGGSAERRPASFSSAELHAILAHLDQEVMAITQRFESLDIITDKTIANLLNRIDSCDALRLYLGANDLDTTALPLVKDILDLAICETRDRVRCLKIGNGHGNNIDRISLPDLLGEYIIFNPLTPDDISAALADHDRELQCRYVCEMLKALTRRSYVTTTQKDYDKLGPLQVARTQSINALWSTYRVLLEQIVADEVLEYVTQRKTEFIKSEQVFDGSSTEDKKFFMMPTKPGVGGLTLWLQSDDVAPANDNARATDEAHVDDEAPADAEAPADNLINEPDETGSIRPTRAASVLRLPPSAASSRRTTVSSCRERPCPDVPHEQFPEFTDPFDALDDAIAAEMPQTHLTPRLRDSSVISVKSESKQPTPLASTHDLKKTIGGIGDIKPQDGEENKDAEEFPSPRLSRTMSWFKAGRNSDEKASRPTFLRNRSFLAKPRPPLKPERRSKSETRPSWLQMTKKFLGKKEKGKKGKGRILESSTTSKTHLLQPVTAGNVDNFLHAGGDTANGVHVPTNTIADPRASVADRPLQPRDATSFQHKTSLPSRYPPCLPRQEFDSALMLPESALDAQARADQQTLSGENHVAQPSPSTSEELAMIRAAIAVTQKRTSSNRGRKRAPEFHRIRHSSERGVDPLEQQAANQK